MVNPPPRSMHKPREDGRVHGVIVGVQRDDGCWLLIRRSAHVPAPLAVAFPGGGIEIDETPEAAAVREAREEVGIDIELVARVWTYVAPDRPLKLYGYHALHMGGDVKPNDHEVAEVLWLTAQQVHDHPDTMPATECFVQALQKSVARLARDA